jgi:hypothetical protein
MPAIGVSAGPQGNPSTEPDGSLRGISAPVPVGVESAGLAALVQQQQRDLRGRQWMEDRLPKILRAADQAAAAGGAPGAVPERYGVVGATATAERPPTSTAALVNASGPRTTTPRGGMGETG